MGDEHVSIRITASSEDAVRGVKRTTTALGDLDDKAGRSGRSMEKSRTSILGFSRAAVAATGITAGAGGLVAGLISTTKAALEAEVSQRKLQTQLQAIGTTYKAHAADIETAIQKHSKLAGIDDEDLQDAFTNIVRATKNVDKGLRLTGLAADIARAKHMDVAKAGELVAKVVNGNTGLLKRYGVQIKDNSTVSEALAQAQKQFAGQAEAYGKTTKGSLDRMRVSVENLQEKIGKALAPSIQKAADKMTIFVDGMAKGTGAGGDFVAAMKVAADGIMLVVKAAKAAAQPLIQFNELIGGRTAGQMKVDDAVEAIERTGEMRKGGRGGSRSGGRPRAKAKSVTLPGPNAGGMTLARVAGTRASGGGGSSPRARASASVTGDLAGLRILPQLQAMAAGEGRAIYVKEGFRTRAEQQAHWNRRPDPKWVARPGTSNHESGDAADISPGSEVFGSVAGKYGLRFPMSWEPWHIEGGGGGGGGGSSSGGSAAPAKPNYAGRENSINAGLKKIASKQAAGYAKQATRYGNQIRNRVQGMVDRRAAEAQEFDWSQRERGVEGLQALEERGGFLRDRAASFRSMVSRIGGRLKSARDPELRRDLRDALKDAQEELRETLVQIAENTREIAEQTPFSFSGGPSYTDYAADAATSHASRYGSILSLKDRGVDDLLQQYLPMWNIGGFTQEGFTDYLKNTVLPSVNAAGGDIFPILEQIANNTAPIVDMADVFKRRAEEAAAAFALSQAELRTFQGFKGAGIPMLGGFDSGGIVPGPLGAPGLALVHGGETILPTHKGAAPVVNVYVSADAHAAGVRVSQQLGRDARRTANAPGR